MDDFSHSFRLANFNHNPPTFPELLRPFAASDDREDDYDEDDDYEDDDYEDSLHRHIAQLSRYYPLWLDDEYRFVIVQDVRLPPGYNYQDTDFLVQLPPDYPFSPPGIGDNRIYTYSELRFRNCRLVDLHPQTNPKFSVRDRERWAWFCYERIDWCPFTDDLIKLLEMIRADLTAPHIE